MQVKTYTQEGKIFSMGIERNLLDSFLKNSNKLGNDSLKVDGNLFLEAVKKQNVQFEFIRIKSFALDKTSKNINNAKNALIEAEYAIADSGQVVLDTSDIDMLFTIYLAETLHVLVPASRILNSMDDLEMIKGKVGVDLGRGITSVHVDGKKSDINFSPKTLKTMVYIIEDL